jgi:hypothetical protein
MIKGDPEIPVSKDTITHNFGAATQRIHLFATLPVDEVVRYQSKIVAFLLYTGTSLTNVELDPVPRGIKDILRG